MFFVVLRYLWAAPTTVLGLAMAIASLRRGHVAIVDGVIEAHSPFLRRALASLTPLADGADAMTLGHVVIGRDARALEITRAHERVHVRQYEVWGPLFIPAYLFAGAWALMRGGHPYFDNRFEREARSASRKPHQMKRAWRADAPLQAGAADVRRSIRGYSETRGCEAERRRRPAHSQRSA